MDKSKKGLVRKLLKGIETGDPEAAAAVNESRYVQHNPLTREGNVGLAELFKRLAKTSPKVEIVRIFEDGEFVFAHTEYDFDELEIGFEVFRFEDGLAVEHWDNLQGKPGLPNPSGHTMLDGPTEVTDHDQTEPNRERVRAFIEDVLIGGGKAKLASYVDAEIYTEHNPHMADGLPALQKALFGDGHDRSYRRLHRTLAEGCFVLSVCEGQLDGTHTSFYDLFRLQRGMIVEHWDTTEAVPPRDEWVNENGKF